MTKPIVAVAVLVVSASLPLNAGWLSGPAKVAVHIEHPPALQIAIDRIAFGPSEGECADELVDALTALFVNEGVEVIDRLHLEALLAEHEFSLSGLVDRRGVAELGKILGPTALVFVNSRRCTTEQQRLVDQRNVLMVGKTVVYISRTTAYFKGSVQVIDLGTARIHSAKAIDESTRLANEAQGMQPEFPSAYEAIDRVLAVAAHRVRQLFFPWTERRDLAFYDAKECDLKLAYNLVQAGDYDGALAQSERNVEACNAYRAKKPKLAARAHYNLGMALFLAGRHDEAHGYLEESLRLNPDEATSTAMAECRRAKETAERMARYEEAEAEQTLASLPQLDLKPPPASSGGSGTPPATDDTSSIEERLKTLEGLLEKGLISEEDYAEKKAEILADL